LKHTIVISCCSASKDDSVPKADNASQVFPDDYLKDKSLVKRLEETREKIFKDPRSMVGTNSTCAFDLYTWTGRAYRNLTPGYRAELKQLMSSNKLSWFFLSGGYGLIHASEPARSYQATFNRTIAYKNGIPYTAKQWKGILSEIIDSAVSNLDPEWVFFFGSQDYSVFFKETKVWHGNGNVRLFESTGSSGPHWLSPLIGKLACALINDQVEIFGQNFSHFTKQEN
jgi:hypothetical protein